MRLYAPKKDERGEVIATTFSCIMGYDINSGTINKIELKINK